MIIDIILFALIIILLILTLFRFNKFELFDVISFGIILGCQVIQLLNPDRTVFDLINTILVLILFIIVVIKVNWKK